LLGAVADESFAGGQRGAGQEGVHLPHEVVHLDVFLETASVRNPLPADGAVPLVRCPLQDAEVTERVTAGGHRRPQEHLHQSNVLATQLNTQVVS
jgi:hypothetical protein